MRIESEDARQFRLERRREMLRQRKAVEHEDV